jgi:hypothetical protein
VVGCQIALGVVRLWNETLFVKAFCRSDHGAVGIANGHTPQVDWNSMAFLVAKIYFAFAGLAFVQSGGHRAGNTTMHAAMVIAMSHDIFATSASQRFVPQVPGYLLGALIPE